MTDPRTVPDGGAESLVDPYPPTPALDKMLAIPEEKRFLVQEFLDWMMQDKGWWIAYYPKTKIGLSGHEVENDELFTVPFRPEQVMAQFFDVDLAAQEKERRSILSWIRRQHDTKEETR